MQAQTCVGPSRNSRLATRDSQREAHCAHGPLRAWVPAQLACGRRDGAQPQLVGDLTQALVQGGQGQV
jgi:hypothetical protein